MPTMSAAIRAAQCPLALTGAGVSAPSGIPTFQTLWKGQPIRDFLGRDYYRRDPVGFFELYCAMEAWCSAEPNAAHRVLANLKIPILTQNIDNLHQKAGSANVIELHGNLRRLLCPSCGHMYNAKNLCATLRPLYAVGDEAAIRRCLTCACGSMVDVDVVLYGDAVRGLDRSIALLEKCDLLVVIGTSLQTYPAAMLPDIAARHGARIMVEDTDCIAALAE
jgi:NAD-dependent protein deacetylases, SIR2 family